MPAAHDADARSPFGQWLVERRGPKTIAQVAHELGVDRSTYEKHELGYLTARGHPMKPSPRLRRAIVRLYGEIPADVDPTMAPRLESRVALLEKEMKAVLRDLEKAGLLAMARGEAAALREAAESLAASPQRRTPRKRR